MAARVVHTQGWGGVLGLGNLQVMAVGNNTAKRCDRQQAHQHDTEQVVHSHHHHFIIRGMPE